MRYALFSSLILNLIFIVSFFLKSPEGSLIFPNSDFEKGTLENWIPKGEAFDGQPVLSSEAEKRKRLPSPFYAAGKYFVGTYEKTAKHEVDDKYVGPLESIPFVTSGWSCGNPRSCSGRSLKQFRGDAKS